MLRGAIPSTRRKDFFLMSNIASTSSKVNTLPQLPTNLGQLATLLIIQSQRTIPARKIAQRTGYKLRNIRYQLKALEEKGLLLVQRKPKKLVGNRWYQDPNSYSSPLFCTQYRSAYIEYIENLYRLTSLKADPRGAKKSHRLRFLIFHLLKNIGQRLKISPIRLFLQGWRHLRKMRYEIILEALELSDKFFKRRGGKRPKNGVGFFLWTIKAQ